MRASGLDEHKVAHEMIRTIDRLSGKEGEEKLLLDALKESCRVLEPPRPADRSASAPNAQDAPVNILLIHHVDRPVRSSREIEASPAREIKASPAAVL
jgi:hypothetical protein